MVRDSRLLIAERLLLSSVDGTSTNQVMTDLVMMCVSGKERTLDDFRALVARAGLRVTYVSHVYGKSAIIECALA